MLGYRHYADDLVDYFVKKSIDNGIDILRIFDALNDVRNLETAINAAKKYGFDGNYVVGANIAGFEKIVNAMNAQGIV